MFHDLGCLFLKTSFICSAEYVCDGSEKTWEFQSYCQLMPKGGQHGNTCHQLDCVDSSAGRHPMALILMEASLSINVSCFLFRKRHLCMIQTTYGGYSFLKPTSRSLNKVSFFKTVPLTFPSLALAQLHSELHRKLYID